MPSWRVTTCVWGLRIQATIAWKSFHSAAAFFQCLPMSALVR
ncbi:hypothetical protein ACWCZ5_03695 [Streptomyces sp. NPDC001667]